MIRVFNIISTAITWQASFTWSPPKIQRMQLILLLVTQMSTEVEQAVALCLVGSNVCATQRIPLQPFKIILEFSLHGRITITVYFLSVGFFLSKTGSSHSKN